MNIGLPCPRLLAVHYFLLGGFLPAVASANRDSLFGIPSLSNPSSGESAGGSGVGLSLAPIDAAIFALCIIFIITTMFQLLSAAFNIPKHMDFKFNQRRTARLPRTLPIPPLSPTAVTYAVGPIFPAALFMTTLCLFVTYVLRAVFWGVFYNENSTRQTFIHTNPEDFITPWAVFSYFTDTFLVMSVFSFVCFRIRRLCYCTCRTKFHLFKRIFDRVLVCTLFILGTAYIGLRASSVRNAKLQVEEMLDLGTGDAGNVGAWFTYIQEGRLRELASLKRAYDGLLLFSALDVGVSSVALYQHAGRYQSVPDRKVAAHIGFVIFPLILLYALIPLISHEVILAKQSVPGLPLGHITLLIDAGVGAADDMKSWDLARVIITCITMTAMVAFLLIFGGASLLDVVRRTNASQDRFSHVQTQGPRYKL